MTKEKLHSLSLVKNVETELEKDKITNDNVTNPIKYSENQIYQKLLNFQTRNEKKRFTVDDLLKW